MLRGGVGGQVTAVSDTSITVSGPNGDTTLTINDTTTVTNDGATAAASDMKTGDTVVITKDSSDASIAKRIVINPQMMTGPSDSQANTN